MTRLSAAFVAAAGLVLTVFVAAACGRVVSPLQDITASAQVQDNHATTRFKVHQRSTRSLPSKDTQGNHARSLMAVTTSNVWSKTKLMLTSLSEAHDSHELLVIDESSTDETPEHLAEYHISTMQVPKGKGVTHSWNQAFAQFMTSGHEYLIIANNDILVPDGAISMLEESLAKPDPSDPTSKAGDCDMVVPMSTIRGKGWWGEIESMEVLHNLTQADRDWVHDAKNYQAVQQRLMELHARDPAACTQLLHNEKRPGFSGFFFAVRKSVAAVAYSKTELWEPRANLHNTGQEGDLWNRLRNAGMKQCINICSFVYHYKAATIPQNVDRNTWVRPDEAVVQK